MKFITWCLGMSALLTGAYLNVAPDWDYGVSFAMGICTWFTAERTMRTLVTLNWRRFHIAALDTWFAVDGIYSIYWFFVNRSVLLDSREAQWPLSLCLYLMCGVIWTIQDPELHLYSFGPSDSKKGE